MDIRDARMQKYHNYLGQAKNLEKEGKTEEAYRYYVLSLEKLKLVTRDETNKDIKQNRIKMIQALETKANSLGKALGFKERSGRRRERGGHELEQEVDDYDQKEFKALVASCIRKSTVRWEDIGGLDETKRFIKESAVLAVAKKNPRLKVKGWANVLLYGPPGTGKTLLATATSNGIDATFFYVKISKVLSKYVGESPKILSTLFEAAREEAPAVVFIDEIEDLVKSRDMESQTSTSLVQAFNEEMDGFEQKSGSPPVMFMAATNKPWMLDDAILQRFRKRIFIPLPDEEARRAIFKILIGEIFQGSTRELVEMTKGYSGRDIENVCNGAIMRMVRESNPNLRKQASDLKKAREYKIKDRPLTVKDIKETLERVKPTTTMESIARYQEWRRKFKGE